MSKQLISRVRLALLFIALVEKVPLQQSEQNPRSVSGVEDTGTQGREAQDASGTAPPELVPEYV